ncbi:MobA/MobL family protein [Gloeobacter kilaueensis JS1]|uniref:MobA/MobL family protein n=2 Tax=Gloeobacter TaxID=33071 RepID=U5QJ38_GLOK1|nr:MobA/MobL family protein [Gloeobacter kilaueensis JS1]
MDMSTGIAADYSRRVGVLHREIIAPDIAPNWALNREELWNMVESFERRSDARLAREVTLSLPAELPASEYVELVNGFVREQFVSRGMIADISIHAPKAEGDKRNFFAQILLTTRPIGPATFAHKKNPAWDKVQLLKTWRRRWAEHINQALEKNGIDQRVDHRAKSAQNSSFSLEIARLFSQMRDVVEKDDYLDVQDKIDILEQIKILTKFSANAEDESIKREARLAIKVLKGTMMDVPRTQQLRTSLMDSILKVNRLLNI